MKTSGKELLEKIARTKFFWLSALLLFVPLLVVTKGAYPYVFYKTIIVEFLAVASFFTYLFLALGNWKKYRPQFNWLTGSIFAWLVWMFIASIFGSNWQVSWWGDWQRSEGLILIAALMLWLVGAQAIFIKNDWIKLIKISVGVSGLISVLAFIQAAGTSITFLPTADRVSSTLGNAAFLATYCLWHIGLALYLYFCENKGYKKYAYLLFLLINLAAMLLTGTRSAVVGLMAAVGFILLIVVISYFRKKSFNNKKRRILIALVIIALIGIGLVFKMIPVPEKVQRLFNWSSSSVTAQTRLIMWKVGAYGALQSPVLGYGYENFEPVFDKYAPAKYYQLANTESWVTRAHNVYIDNLVYGGFVGLILYLLIWLMAGLVLWQKWRQEKTMEALVFMALLIAYLVQNVFIFDSVATFTVLFLVLGYIGFTDRKLIANKELNDISLASLPIIILVTLAFGYWQIQVWRVGINLHQVTNAIVTGHANVANEKYQKIKDLDLNSWNADVAIVDVLAKTVSAKGVELFNEADLKTFAEGIDNDFKKYISNNQRAQIDFFYQRNLIILSQVNKDKEIKDRLLLSLADSRKKYSNDPQFLWSQITASLIADKNDEAKKFTAEAMEKFPDNSLGYWFASIMAFDAGNDSDGFKYATEAIKRGYEVPIDATWQKLYDHYYEIKSWDEIERLLNMYIKQDPEDYDGYMNLADVMVKQGRFAEARQMLINKTKTDKASTDDMFKEIQKINQIEKYGQATTTTK